MKQLMITIIIITSTVLAQPWVQLGSDIDGEAVDDYSGTSVALSSDGSRVAIGAHGNDGNGHSSGQVRIFDWDAVTSAWVQVGIDIDGEAVGDQSGYSVSLSSDGSRVAIGAPNNGGNGFHSGQVRIFDWDGSAWVQVGIDIDGEAASDQSGVSVSLSSDGSRVAIGAPGNNAGHGQVRIFDWDGSAWVQVGIDIDGEAASDRSGESVSLSSDGSRVAIGAYMNDGNGTDSGHVRIYDWDGSAWVQVGADIDGEAAADWSGYSVSLSSDGSRVAIGAFGNDGANGTDSGHVRIFDWDAVTSAWVQVGIDIDGEAAGDKSGFSVSLSSDGSYVAIGAYRNDGNGTNSGHVRIYDWDGSAWVQVGVDIGGEAASDYSGASVSLSSDGSRVAIGAYMNDGNGANSGHTRVYYDEATVPVELSAFTATATLSGVELEWRTESETENLGFTLERKTANSEFTQIASYTDNGSTGEALTGQGSVSYATDYSYTDELVEAGVTYEYRLSDVDYNGVVTYHATRTATVGQAPLAKVEEFTVLPAYPNPFNPSTTIRYFIPRTPPSKVDGIAGGLSIQIYDLTGKLIATLFNGEQTSGWHSIVWNGTNAYGEQVPAGIYFSRVRVGNEVKTNKLMLLK